MYTHRRDAHGGQREGQSQNPEETRTEYRAKLDRFAFALLRGLRLAIGLKTEIPRPTAQDQGMQWYRDSPQQNPEYEYRLPPSMRHEQRIGQGHEDGAGETRDQGEDSHGPAPFVHEPGGDNCKGGLVKDGSAAETPSTP